MTSEPKRTAAVSSFRLPFNRLAEGWAVLRASWVWSVVLFPFLLTRLVWILVAAFARGVLQPNPTYAQYYQQGGQLTKSFLLDIFAHWDAKYYLTIITDGYWNNTDLTQRYSNVAFYPLYPYLVKSVGWLGIDLPTGIYLLIGILLSNLCFLASAVLLYRLARRHLGFDEAAAKRALLLLFVFPASFFFSSFYTESLFLFLSLLGFTAALERRWWLAGIAAALVVLTRTQGLLVLAALGWVYMSARGWRLREIRADVLWFALAPTALLAHLYSLYRITGNFLAPYTAVQAWGRNQYGFFEGLKLQLEAPVLDVFKIDAMLLLVFLICGFLMLRKYPRIFGIYTILMCAVPVSTGLLVSATRYIAVIFPVFLFLGQKLERREWFDAAWVTSFALQILYFAAWTNFYWVA